MWVGCFIYLGTAGYTNYLMMGRSYKALRYVNGVRWDDPKLPGPLVLPSILTALGVTWQPPAKMASPTKEWSFDL